MDEMSDNQREPFQLTAASDRMRLVPVRRDHESNTDTGFTTHLNQDDGDNNDRTVNVLRRRYRRRGANLELDLEEGNGANHPLDVSEVPDNREHDATHPEPSSTLPTIELPLSNSAEERTTGREPPLPSMHRSNFTRKPDDKLREKFKNLIRNADGASKTLPLDKAQPKVEDKMMSNRNDHPLPIIHHSNYIRKPDEKLREKFKNLIRSPADGIPEVHIIGELSEGTGFRDTYVSCKWYLEWGKAWSFLAGEDTSQTQYAASDDRVHIWNHPIDVHFATASMQGWPRIIMQLWELDEYGRSILSGYGFAHFPTNPGYHELEIRCWRPSGSILEELNAFFLGMSACLVDEKVIFGKAWETRSQLNTVSSGTVKMNIHILVRYFNEQKVALPSGYRVAL